MCFYEGVKRGLSLLDCSYFKKIGEKNISETHENLCDWEIQKNITLKNWLYEYSRNGTNNRHTTQASA
jgi:hypothetical protein